MIDSNNFFVIGIGASAGGLDAVQKFFDKLPDDSGNAYVIIQHLSPDFKSLMPELLSKHTKMPILTAEQDLEIKPNHIYLNQRNKNIGIENGKFILLEKAQKDHINLPIDIFFHMLGENYRERSIAVILSGTGSDGSRGIKSIKEAGGTIFVQDPSTAQFDGMPNSAIRTNLCDFILSVEEIVEKIKTFTAKKLDYEDIRLYSKEENVFQKIISTIEKYSGVSFSKYKVNTLLRRLEKRMNLHNFQTMEDYFEYLNKNAAEKEALKQEFLIGVTSFFRDKDSFEVLKNIAIPEICKNKNKQQLIRIWIAGCSTGEEVYSIAILFEDYIRNNKLGLEYKIFATDIDKNALRQASLGIYPVNVSGEIEKNYFEEYFVKTGEKIQIIKRIREKVVFSYHDVAKDPPFINVDLISCRNLLIYLNNEAQNKIIANFSFALNNGGYLFLGNSETLGGFSSSFKSIDAKYKIFQNIADNKRIVLDNKIENETGFVSFKNFDSNYPRQYYYKSTKYQENDFYSYLCKKHAPVSVFIEEDFEIKFILGDFRKWFKNSEGIYSNSLLNIISSDIASIIKNSIRKVKKTNKPVLIKNLIFELEEEKIATNISIEKPNLAIETKQIFLIQFEEVSKKEAENLLILSNEEISSFSKQRIEELETELKEAKLELQNVIEELETSNEELQSSNEELMSSNEELQSSNEELQSLNEELFTVNAELQEKNRELEALNNDITNLFNSAEIAILFIDLNLNIRKFSPSITKIFNLKETDIGRNISNFSSSFDEKTSNSIINDVKNSIENLRFFEREILDKDGKCYLVRINPFITLDKKIEGSVITFVDISNLKKAQSELSELGEKLSIALNAGNMAWWEMYLPSGEVKFSDKKVQMLDYSPKDFKTYDDFMRLLHPDDYDATMQKMMDHIEGKNDYYSIEYRIRHSNGEYLWFKDMGKIVFRDNDKIIVSGVVIDITEIKKTHEALIDAKQKAELANVYKSQFLANMSHEIRTPLHGIIGFASLLRDEIIKDQESKKYIDIIENSANQLLNLINDIIDIAKIEAGEFKVINESFDLNKLMKELLTYFNQLKLKKGKDNIEILWLIGDNYDEFKIVSDPFRLRQVLSNLLINALKFTEKGMIEFGYSVSEDKLNFFVKDTGIGIPENKTEIIFHRFQQLDLPKNIINDGTGLGLAISKGIVEKLGGKIWVESEEGKGSEFKFYIPLVKVENNKNRRIVNENKRKFEGQKILIVEDNEINNEYYREALKDLNLNIYWAKNGEEAIDIFEKESDIKLILMDLRMPGMNGFEAAKAILNKKPEMYIVAQTAYAMSGDREKCLERGFVDYIAKPISKDTLINTIAKWIE